MNSTYPQTEEMTKNLNLSLSSEWQLWETKKKFILFVVIASLSIGFTRLAIKLTVIKSENLFHTFIQHLPGEIFESFFNLFLIFSIFYFFINRIRLWKPWNKILFYLFLTISCISLETFIDSCFPILNVDFKPAPVYEPDKFFFRFFGDTLLYFIILSLFTYIDTILDKKRLYFTGLLEEKSRSSLKEAQRIKAELKALQTQINPHFFFNALNSLSTLVSIDPAKAGKFIEDMSDMYRIILGSDKKELWTVKEEIHLIQNYINIEKVRFGERLLFTVNCVKEVEKLYLPCFLIQPLVENAIKHSIAPSISGGEIKVSIEMKEDLFIRVEDSRKEKVTARENSERERTGLENIKKRLLLTYGEKSEFTLDLKEFGALATIRIRNQ